MLGSRSYRSIASRVTRVGKSKTAYDLDITFGRPCEEDIFRLFNFCILHGKKYIFDYRINENIVSVDRFKSKLSNRLEVEIYIVDSCDVRLNSKKNFWLNCVTA